MVVRQRDRVRIAKVQVAAAAAVVMLIQKSNYNRAIERSWHANYFSVTAPFVFERGKKKITFPKK